MAISKGKFEGLTRVSYKGEICTVKVYEKGICETEDGHLLKLGQAQYERFLEAQKKSKNRLVKKNKVLRFVQLHQM